MRNISRSKQKILALLLGVILFFQSCTSNTPSSYSEVIEYTDTEISITSKENGNVKISSNSMGAQFNIEIKDSNGNPIDNYMLNYSEKHGEFTIWGYDPQNRYGQVYLEYSMEEFLKETNSEMLSVNSTPSESLSNNRAVSLALVGITLFVGAIATAGVAGIIHFENAKAMVKDNYDGVYNGGDITEFTYDELIDWAYKIHVYNETVNAVVKAEGLIQTVLTDKAAEHVHPLANLALGTADIIGNVTKAVTVNDPYGEEYDYLKKEFTNHLCSQYRLTQAEVEAKKFWIVFLRDKVITKEIDNEQQQVRLWGARVFLTDPRLETLSGLYKVIATVENSNNISIYPIGKQYTGHTFIKAAEGNSLELYDMNVNESPSKFKMGTGSFDKATGDFSGIITGDIDTIQYSIDTTIHYTGAVTSMDKIEGNLHCEDKWSPSGDINLWDGSFIFYR